MIRQVRILVALLAGLVCGVGGGLAFRQDPPRRANAPAFRQFSPGAPPMVVNALPLPDLPIPAVSGIPAAESSLRPVYRHSIVPGGVFSGAEAAQAAARMPEVAQHYRDLNFRRLTPARGLRGGFYYASYRRDKEVFWTSYRLHVPPGEAVLSDGGQLVRARCGNLLSEKPLKPILPPALEPIEAEMAEVDIMPLPHIVAPPDSGRIWLALLPLLPLVIPHGGGGGGGGGGGDHQHDDPVVPEPSPGSLIAFGLGTLAAAQLLSTQRRSSLKRRWFGRPGGGADRGELTRTPRRPG